MMRPMSIVLLCLVAAAAAPRLTGAEEKKGTNAAAPEAVAGAKANDAADKVQKVALAHSLIRYARKSKAPEGLITAARILAEVGGEKLEAKPTSVADPKAPKAGKKDKPVADNSPKALLAEAKKLSGDDPAIVKLANSVELSRGAVGGPKRAAHSVNALGTDSFSVTFRGGEVARVAISGDGDTRLDLFIYDEFGNLVDSRVGPGDDAMASWVPKWTGKFTIKVVNRGIVYNRYVIVTN